jgi:N-acetylglucosaminyl-diphospho-decaprenol L-rhamnosyltransferase
MLSVSTMTVIFNSGEDVLDCIASLQAAGKNLQLEIIVVDNASTNEIPARIKQQFPEITYIQSEQNLGFGGGNNLAFRYSHGDFILCSNPDLVLNADALTMMLQYLQEHHEVGVVGPRTLDESSEPAITARAEYTLWRLWAKYWAVDKFFPWLVYKNYPTQVKESTVPFDADWLQGSCLLIRRQAFEAVGGFDETFFLYMEDADLCERIHQQGWRIVYLPQAEVHHHGGTTTSRFHLIRIRSYHQSPIHYYRKRGSYPAVYFLKAIFAVELLAKVVVRSLSNRINYQEARASQLQSEWQVFKEIWRY